MSKIEHPGDFSRLTFDPAKHFGSVLMQQGRVQLDSDWNEQVAITAHRMRTQALDFIGATGAPVDASGFEVVPRTALAFDGRQQYLTLGTEATRLYSSVAALELEAVIKPRKGGPGGVVACRFDGRPGSDSLQFSYMLSVRPDGRLRFTQAGGEGRHLLSDRPLPFGQWSRVTLTHDASGCRLAIDGQAAGSSDRAATVESQGALFLVGLAQLRGEGTQGFEGWIRELRLAEPLGDRSETLGHWRFDSVEGDVTLDQSPNSNHAVLGGGAPDARPTLELHELLVSPGRYYVDGALCENEAWLSLAGPALPERTSAGASYLFYLDVWERYVAPAQDPDLREPALDGADTAGRTRTVAAVKWLPIEIGAIPEDSAATLPEWEALASAHQPEGSLRVVRPNAAPGTLENRLYRVQVHESGSDGRWKWSRDNGSVVLPIDHLETGGRTLVLGALGGGPLPIAAGDWLEITDEEAIRAEAVTPLVRVESVDDSSRTATLSESMPGSVGTRPELMPVAVRWEGVAPLADNEWLRVEHGIDVRFEGSASYRAGDHWTFTARSSTGTIGWPQDGDGEPLPVPPGGRHGVSPLAILRFGEVGFELRDCRPTFQPLTSGAVSKAGDRMRGPLEIRPDGGSSETEPALRVRGVAVADTLLGALGSPSSVHNFNLAAGSVSRSKIAPDVGTVPPGFAILGAGPEPPPGYESTGSQLVVPNPDPQWETTQELDLGEDPGELRSVAIDQRVYTFSASGRVWVYDCLERSLLELEPMPEPRRRFAVAAAGGRAYLVGGVNHQGSIVGATLEFDPGSERWAWRRDMPTPRCDVALAEVDGKLYALGGIRELLFFEVVSRRNEAYDPLVDSWSRRRGMPSARFAMTSAAGRRGAFAFGGRRRWFFKLLGQAISAANDEYLPGVDRWASRPNLMPAPRSHGAAAAIGDAIFVVGGRSLFGWTSDTSRFAPRGDGWESTAQLPAPVASPGVAAVDGSLVLHATGPTQGSLTVSECRIASHFHVHRKSAEPIGDLEPQLALDEPELDGLAQLDLTRGRPTDPGTG